MTMPLCIFMILPSQPQLGSRDYPSPAVMRNLGRGLSREGTYCCRPRVPWGPAPSPALAFRGGKKTHRDEKMPRALSTGRCHHGFLCLPVSYPQDSHWRERLFSYPFHR